MIQSKNLLDRQCAHLFYHFFTLYAFIYYGFFGIMARKVDAVKGGYFEAAFFFLYKYQL
jgi:hypothetical protein